MLSSLTPFQIFGMEWVAFLALILLVPLIVFIFVAVWMYRDAESRGMGGGLWVILLVVASLFASFIGGIIVLVIYLVVRESHPVGGPYAYGYVPPQYGYPYYYPPPGGPPVAGMPSPAMCRRCGTLIPFPDARFCPNCGTAL